MKSKIQNTGLFWFSLIVVIVAAVLLRAKLLHSFSLSADEGIHLIWLRLLSAGYRPYSEVYITYPPLYPLALETVWQIWPTENAQRWFSVAYTIFGVVGITLVARKFAGAIAGVVAAALLLFSPTLFEFSRAILGEFPSVAWSVWAIFLAWLYRDAGDRRRLLPVLAGVCMAFSLLTKFLSPFLLALLPLILLTRWILISDAAAMINGEKPAIGINRTPATQYELKFWQYKLQIVNYKLLLIDLLIWGGALLLTIIFVIFMFDLGPVFAQVVGQRLEARAVYLADEGLWQPWLEIGLEFVQSDMALMILALAGLIIAWVRRQKDLWLMLVWLGLAVAMLIIHTPLRDKHFVILLPLLGTFGGLAVSFWIDNVMWWFKNRKSAAQVTTTGSNHKVEDSKYTPTLTKFKIIALGGVVLLALLYFWQVPAALALWQARAAVPQPPTDEVEALAFIQEVTAPDDCLITDDMPLLYWSGRMAPPELAEVSSNRLKSGALKSEELISISDRYDCQLVAAVSNRIPKYLPDYMDWVKTKYLGRFHYGEDDLFFAKIDTDPNPDRPLRAQFGEQIIFHGYTLSHTSAAPGDRVALKLLWQVQTKLDTDYAIFVHLRDATHNTLVNADHQPYKGLLPTSKWPKGAVIQEVTWLPLPPDLPAGRYNIYVGLYRPEDLSRLPLLVDTSGENALVLGPLLVP